MSESRYTVTQLAGAQILLKMKKKDKRAICLKGKGGKGVYIHIHVPYSSKAERNEAFNLMRSLTLNF